jgi:hypothetical protein
MQRIGPLGRVTSDRGSGTARAHRGGADEETRKGRDDHGHKHDPGSDVHRQRDDRDDAGGGTREQEAPAEERHGRSLIAQHGDVNPLGDLVDLQEARRRRFRQAVGPHRSDAIDPDEQAELALELLEQACERHSIRCDLLIEGGRP